MHLINKIKILALCSISALLMSACTKEVIREVPVLPVSVTANSDAESLALAGEQLISPYTFHQADMIFSLALEKEPTNKRALLYKNFLKKMMVFKGILTRVKPFARTYGNISQLEKTIRELPVTPLSKWLIEGREDIATSADIQSLLVQYRQGADDFRKFLKENPDLDLTLNLNPNTFKDVATNNLWRHCQLIQKPNSEWEVACDWKNLLTRQLSPADALALSQVAAGEVLYFSVLTGYSAEGIDQLDKLEKSGSILSTAGRQQFLESIAGFGVLRKDHNLSIVRELGSDLSAAVKYALQYQKQLCPKEQNSDKPSAPWFKKPKRHGYVFDQGICIENLSETERDMALLDQALLGVTSQLVKLHDQSVATIRFDAFAWSDRPVVDLRIIAPASYDDCGQVSSMRDASMGGVLVDKNVDLFLAKDCTK